MGDLIDLDCSCCDCGSCDEPWTLTGFRIEPTSTMPSCPASAIPYLSTNPLVTTSYNLLGCPGSSNVATNSTYPTLSYASYTSVLSCSFNAQFAVPIPSTSPLNNGRLFDPFFSGLNFSFRNGFYIDLKSDDLAYTATVYYFVWLSSSRTPTGQKSEIVLRKATATWDTTTVSKCCILKDVRNLTFGQWVKYEYPSILTDPIDMIVNSLGTVSGTGFACADFTVYAFPSNTPYQIYEPCVPTGFNLYIDNYRSATCDPCSSSCATAERQYIAFVLNGCNEVFFVSNAYPIASNGGVCVHTYATRGAYYADSFVSNYTETCPSGSSTYEIRSRQYNQIETTITFSATSIKVNVQVKARLQFYRRRGIFIELFDQLNQFPGAAAGFQYSCESVNVYEQTIPITASTCNNRLGNKFLPAVSLGSAVSCTSRSVPLPSPSCSASQSTFTKSVLPCTNPTFQFQFV